VTKEVKIDRMSKIQLSPCVNLAGRAREAMEFYQRILGGKLELLATGEKGESRPAPAIASRMRGSRRGVAKPFGINWVVTIESP